MSPFDRRFLPSSASDRPKPCYRFRRAKVACGFFALSRKNLRQPVMPRVLDATNADPPRIGMLA
jgi:hypothetical protein